MPGPTVKELKTQAKAQGVKGYSTMKKAELIKVLGSSPAKSPAPQKVTYRWQVLMSNAMWEMSTGKKSKDVPVFVDFQKATSSYIENRWQDFQNSSSTKATRTQFGLPVGHGTSGGKVDFKKMVVKWVLKVPVGNIGVVSRIRRVAN